MKRKKDVYTTEHGRVLEMMVGFILSYESATIKPPEASGCREPLDEQHLLELTKIHAIPRWARWLVPVAQVS